MKRLLQFVLISSFLIINFSCKKYEDGPAFSFYPKKTRLCTNWYPDKIIQYGNDITQTWTSGAMQCYRITYDRNGTYDVTAENYASKGSWEFIDKKNKLRRISFVGDTLDFKILRLSSKELWLFLDELSMEMHFGQDPNWCGN